MLRFVTVKDGQRAAVWNKRGEVRYVDGPKRLFLFRETVEWLRPCSATNGEYLVVRGKDGRVEHVRGPVQIWFDPVRHASIEVEECITLDANEALVVYRRSGETVDRRIERGPLLFMPTADEWLHRFSWHGADPNNLDRKIPRALRFTKLRVIPDQMYFDVEDVRTADDALLTIKLMVFFELADIERMLDKTHDVIADFINALSADVIDFAATLTFERFKEQTEALNDIGTYEQLVARAERIGYKIGKVVYRGYAANRNLQTMHDNAIEARTKLKLEAETERQAQELEDMKLTREAERATQRREMEVEDTRHKSELLNSEHEQKLERDRLEQVAAEKAKERLGELELTRRRGLDEQRLAFLDTMKGIGVDLTRYLVAQYQNPDRLIKVDGSGKGTQLHLHEN